MNWVIISSLASKPQVGMLFFSHFIIKWNWRPVSLKSWHFKANEDNITKFKSQGIYTLKIKYWNANGSGFSPSLLPALQNIGILHHKKAKLPKYLQQSVCSFSFWNTFFSKMGLISVLIHKTIWLDSFKFLTNCEVRSH